MVLQFSVKHNVDAVASQVEARFQKQVPFAAAKAITATAKSVARVASAEIDHVFDRPVSFTQKSIGITWATKQSLTAKIFVKDIQAKYLALQVAGGTRRPAKRALLVPGKAAQLNAYGNLPRGAVKKLLARRDVFSGTVGGVAGIWQRVGRGVRLLVLYEAKAEYRKRFPFAEIAQREIERSLMPNLRAALREAIASAQ